MVAAFKRPGWYRALLGTLIAAALGVGLVVVLRSISGPLRRLVVAIDVA